MDIKINHRFVIIIMIIFFTAACTLLNLGGPEGSPAALTQEASTIETNASNASQTNINQVPTPQIGITNSSETATPDTSVPDGTYVGPTTLPEYWDTYSEGGWGQRTIEENEITIIVSPSGDVSGGLIFVWKGSPVQVPGESCVYTINIYSTAILSGKLLETGGTIDVAEELSTEILRSGCPSDSETNSSNNNYQAQVSINDNRIIKGNVSDYFTGSFSFDAMKQ